MNDAEESSPILEYTARNTGQPRRDSLHSLSRASFIAGLTGGALTLVLLFVGFDLGGAGHGQWAMWYVGLLLGALSWSAMLTSSISGVTSWARTGRPVWWTIPATLVVAAMGGLGVWGLLG